jgi:hypothetical protein
MHGRVHKTLGLTLIEMTLVLGTMVLLIGFAVPAVRSLTHSFQSEGAVKSMIDAALSSARAMAMSRQRYVGVRFQKLCTSDDPANPLKGTLDAPQYMIFIMSEEAPSFIQPEGSATFLPWEVGFRAVDGLDPIKLPDTVGVMDISNGVSPIAIGVMTVGFEGDDELVDATTFCIIFSPSGRLVVKDVRVRNRDGIYQPRNDPGSQSVSHDDIFNSAVNICQYHEGRFIQDDYSRFKNLGSSRETEDFGLGRESSVTRFVIYDTATLRSFFKSGSRPSPVIDYLWTLRSDKSVYVNSYTGHLILPD